MDYSKVQIQLTLFSKYLKIFLFVIPAFMAFYLGIKYYQTQYYSIVNPLSAAYTINPDLAKRQIFNCFTASTKAENTVFSRLTSMKAYCNEENKLVDKNGKEIYIYEVEACFKQPPSESVRDAAMKKDEKALKELREKYTIIIKPCLPR